MPFSIKYGFKKPKLMQKQGLDEDTINRIWNSMFDELFLPASGRYYAAEELRRILEEIFKDKYKVQSDKLKLLDVHGCIGIMKKHLYNIKWYEVFDTIEYLLEHNNNHYPNIYEAQYFKKFIEQLNNVLEEEKVNYAIVGNVVCSRLPNDQLLEIDRALDKSNPFVEASNLLEKAVRLFSDRRNPDYPNCVKEAVISIETVLRKVVGAESGTLTDLVKERKIREKVEPLLLGMLEKAYHYSSDASCVRHGAKDSERFPNKVINEKEARFMLVYCSAAFNYLVDTFK